jgi:hypothetical protein
MMTTTEEARFIQLWQQGLIHEAMARQLGCPVGTVKSRLHTVLQQGKIEPRRARQTPAQRERTPPPAPHPRRTRETPTPPPARPPAEATAPTREAPAITMVAVPELREIINRFSALEARVAALEDGTRAPPAPAPAPAPTRAPGTIKQWTLRLSQPLIEAVKAEAATAGKEPSHLVEELLWTALTARLALTAERREP